MSETALDVSEAGIPPRGLYSRAWARFRRNTAAMTGLIIAACYFFVALFAPMLPLYPYEEQVLDHQFLPPSLFKTSGELLLEKRATEFERRAQAEGRTLTDEERRELEQLEREVREEPRHQRRYLLGTDYLGRDMFSRIVYGGQISMSLGLLWALTSIVLGIVVGSIAGYFGGKVDAFLMRLVDILYSLPYMLLVIIFMAVFGRNVWNLVFALAAVSWLTEARIVRGQILGLKNSEFVQAARVVGASDARILIKHLLPNIVNIVIVFTTLRIPSFILMEAFLSFLGLGVSAPLASWGTLIQDAVGGMTLYPWRLFFPALAMVIFLLAMNFLGDGLRDALDPRGEMVRK